MLVPRLARPEVLASLRAEFASARRVRIAAAFPEARAVACLTALRGSQHRAAQRVDAEHGFQIWRFGFVPGVGCDHPLCELGRWLHGDAVAWAAALTGRSLLPESDPMLFSDKAAKAAFRDTWDARADAPGRVLAVQVHFTPASWPAAWGGHLELLAGPRGAPVGAPVEALAPAWNAIDLIEVSAPTWCRLPLIDRHVEGFTISGGFRAGP